MRRDELLARISINPEVCFGKPTIRGHRIWMSLVLDLLSSGMGVEEILEEFPGIEPRGYSRVHRVWGGDEPERFVDVPMNRPA